MKPPTLPASEPSIRFPAPEDHVLNLQNPRVFWIENDINPLDLAREIAEGQPPFSLFIGNVSTTETAGGIKFDAVDLFTGANLHIEIWPEVLCIVGIFHEYRDETDRFYTALIAWLPEGTAIKESQK